MISNRIFTFILCGIFFVFFNLGAKAAPPFEEFADTETIPFEPNLQPFFYAGEEEPVELINDYTDRKFKRQTPIGKKQSIEEILPKIPSERVKELLKMLNKPKKSEILTLNGWSASGMPFNVLYTPNILQQKMLSAPEKKPVQVTTPEPPSEGNYINGKKANKKENIRTGTKPQAKLSQMRKHYLVIPQLFVSYGWGPIGNIRNPAQPDNAIPNSQTKYSATGLHQTSNISVSLFP